jgi:heme/copper-type cytochrome/quinol oxidase subunit 3
MAQGEHVLSTPEEIAHEQRAAEGAMWTGSRLLIGIPTFVFASLAFAYFYLRSENNEDLWRPHGVTASVAIGTSVLVVALVTAAMNAYGTWRRHQGGMIDWQVAGWLTVTGGCLAIGLQVYELFELHFWPGSSGYASCFIAWAVLNACLLLSGTYWTETLLARALRLQRAVQEEGTAGSRPPTARLVEIEVIGARDYWLFIALVSLVFWLMFYII